MARVKYWLVCHETQSMVCVGEGEHLFDTLEVDAESLARFLYDNCAFTMGMEYERQDLMQYRRYEPHKGG